MLKRSYVGQLTPTHILDHIIGVWIVKGSRYTSQCHISVRLVLYCERDLVFLAIDNIWVFISKFSPN
jgi:hypothetical protein